jgi:DNA polymerase (family 10)
MVSNTDLARIFEEFSEILELQNSDRFRIIAYQRASQAIRSHGESLQVVYTRGGEKELQKITGIGESIAAKIAEYIKTGKVKELERLKGKAPKAEVEFLKIPGVGPKTATKLFKELKAEDVSDLKSKLRKQGSRYFKEKSLNKILKGIEISKRLGGRKLLSEVRPYVEELVLYLKKSGVQDVVPVGSYRRWKDTVGDVDIVATAERPEEIISRFVKFPSFNQIVNKGGTKSAAIHKGGFQVDLEILPSDEFGSLLQHFTGSKEHNVALRTYAQAHGFSVSEHGIKISSGPSKGKTIKCANEKQVYSNLKMDYIEPEMREDRGEIDAALKHRLPELVQLKEIKGDLHTHSNWSDGQNTILQLAEEAKSLGYEFIAISDHTVSLGIARGLNEERFKERQKEIEHARKKFPEVTILNSCEINIKPDGTLDLDDEIMGTFDVVTASVHWSFDQSKESMTARIIKAIENPYVDIIGHPTGRLINQREGYDADWQKVFEACVKNKVALEINSFPERLDLTDSLVFEARKLGVKFAISTDAHSIGHFPNMVYGVSVARRGWCEREDVLNALGAAELGKWLKAN